MPLTATQRRLKEEIEDIATEIGMDHWNIDNYDEEARTIQLWMIRSKLIRGEIVICYTLIDEYLTDIICNYYFNRRAKDQSYRRLWKKKKFQIFNHQMMDEMYVLGKMRVVHAIGEMPTKVRDCIERINALRNDIAHSLFPENRKAHMPKKTRLYQGEDIFTLAGVKKFREDFETARDYLMPRAALPGPYP
jgi:hypothetical protein